MVEAIKLQPTLAPQMVQVLSLVAQGAAVREALTLQGQRVVLGVVTPKVVVVREVLRRVHQAAQALHVIMVVVMVAGLVEEIVVQLQVWVEQEASQAVEEVEEEVVTLALQEQAARVATEQSEFIVGR